MTIVDDLVSVDDLIENYLTAEPINEYVQSCDIVAFNKIWEVCWCAYIDFLLVVECLCLEKRVLYEFVEVFSYENKNKLDAALVAWLCSLFLLV